VRVDPSVVEFGSRRHKAGATRPYITRLGSEHQAQLSALLCGLDKPARINRFGHPASDACVQAYAKDAAAGNKNDYRDAEAIAEAVQRPTMNFVAIKTPEQSDLLSLHRVRSRLVRWRTAIINQIRGFLIERGIDPIAQSCSAWSE